MNSVTPLFRPEAVSKHKQRLEGEVLLAGPMTWHAIVLVYVLLIAGAAAYLLLGSYARSAVVNGQLVPTAGLISVTSRSAGLITDLNVQEGDDVGTGDPLLLVRTERDSGRNERSVEGNRLRAVEAQIALGETQLRLAQAVTEATITRLRLEMPRATAEAAALADQLVAQQSLIQLSQKEIAELRPLVSAGSVSRRDLQRREEALISREQQLAVLRQQLVQVTSRTSLAEREIDERLSQQALDANRATAALQQLAERRAELEGSRSFVVTAPVAGRVTSLTVHVGDVPDPAKPLMTIIPRGATLIAELAIPPSAIGFVRAGQRVRLRLEAFPFQRFGSLEARLDQLATAPTPSGVQPSNSTPTYRATAIITDNSFSERLQAGMTFKATIQAEHRTLLEWLLEPMFTIARR